VNIGLCPLARRLNSLPEGSTEVNTFYRLSLRCYTGIEDSVRQCLPVEIVEIADRGIELMGMETSTNTKPGTSANTEQPKERKQKICAALVVDGDRNEEIETIVSRFTTDSDIISSFMERLTNVPRD
jgi:hypothetical protein